MGKPLIYLIGIIGFILICFFCIQCHGEKIENDLKARATAQLQTAGINIDPVMLNGRDVTLRGKVPSPAIADKAVQLAADTRGVRMVHNELTVEIPPPPKPKVEEVQVELNTLIADKRVDFQTGSAVILSRSYPLLDQVAEVLKKRPESKIEIAGHTDSSGDDAMNLSLSQRRAESVRQYLIGKGLKAETLVAKGYGETRPIANNTTAAGRQENRRVEFNILEEK